MLTQLREWVDTNSGTRNRSGVLRIQQSLGQLLEAEGFGLEWIENPNGASVSGPLLVARRDVGEKNPVVSLVGHADTVFEADHPFQKSAISADGKTATGPGIIDDKGSLVVGLEAVRKYLAVAASHGMGLQFVVSPNEEIGSPGFHAVFQKLSKRSCAVFGLEPSLDNGDIITRRKGGRWYEIAVTGKEAHAGRAHHEGVNAAHELAVKLDKLQNLTDYKRGMTVNIGSLEGGHGKFNIVCGHAVGRIDVRYETSKSGGGLFKKIESILKKQFVGRGKLRAKTKFTIEDSCPPLEPQKSNAPWIAEYAKAVKRLEGRAPKAGFSGGGSDSSHFGRAGLVVLDGVGAVGGKIHTVEEYLTVSSLKTRSDALCILLQRAAAEF